MAGEQHKRPSDEHVQARDVPELTTADLDRICLSNLLTSSTDTIYFKDLDSRFIRVSESQARHTGAASPTDMLGKTDFDYFTAEHAEAAYAAEQRIIRTGEPCSDVHEYDALPGDRRRIVSSTKQPLRDADGRIIGTFGISRDVSARRMMQAQLLAKTAELDQLSRELRTILDISPDCIARFDPELRFLYANPAAEALCGSVASDLVGRTNRDLNHPEDFVAEWEDALRQVLASGRPCGLENTFVAAGTRRYLHTRFVPELDEAGSVRSILAVSRDLTDRKRIEDVLAEEAVHDPLTRLANRRLLTDRIEQAVGRLGNASCELAVLFIDLDGFKAVNDALGHSAGDALLVAVAARLRRAARRGDLVARFGGDEFVILCEGINTPDAAASVAQRVIAALDEPFDGLGIAADTDIGASVGIAIAHDSRMSAEALLRHADAAMYRVKNDPAARGTYGFADRAPS